MQEQLIRFHACFRQKIDETELFGVFANKETSIFRVGIQSVNFSTIDCVGSVFIRDKKLAAAFALPGICSTTVLKERIRSTKFHDEGCIILTSKNRVRLKLSVRTKMGFSAPPPKIVRKKI